MLYIVNKRTEALDSCIERVMSNDVVLLIEEAVLATVITKPPSILSKPIDQVQIYALSPDMKARGIDVNRCYEHIRYVDYAGFVELVENNNPVRSCC